MDLLSIIVGFALGAFIATAGAMAGISFAKRRRVKNASTTMQPERTRPQRR